MIVSIHQPHVFPWLGYVDKMAKSDVFILFDNAQYVKHEWQNRNYVKSPNGKVFVTIPVAKSRLSTSIAEKRTRPCKEWHGATLEKLSSYYRTTRFWPQLGEQVSGALKTRTDSLVDIATSMLAVLCDHFSIKARICRASQLAPRQGNASEYLADLVQQVGGTHYLSGEGGHGYLELNQFEKSGIDVVWQSFSHPTYDQQFMELGFIPNLFALDLLFNHGPRSRSILNASV